MMLMTDDLRVLQLRALISPALLIEELPLTPSIVNVVTKVRQQANVIIRGQDDRLLVIVGPCSIHDPKAAFFFAEQLLPVVKELQDELCIIMRVYFEKPRTTVGWKGLINDPHLDGSFAINDGLRLARKLLLDINAMGLAAGTEFLDTIIPQYIADLISWGAIGARTTESQIHRELASGLSMPVGFKNGTTGNVQVAMDAVLSASYPHHFLGLTKQGTSAIVSTRGNEACHVILRGSSNGPNYSAEHIEIVRGMLEKTNLPQRIMVDCSHGNSQKDHNRQMVVAQELSRQIAAGNQTIGGVMLESHLVAGKQELKTGQPLTYGQSITDACLGLDDTVKVLQKLREAVQLRRAMVRPRAANV